MVEDILNRPPERLFRYRSARTDYLFDEIEQAISRRIFFSNFAAMNDPFEATPRYAKSSLREFRDLIHDVRSHGGMYTLTTGTKLDVSGRERRAARAAFKRRFRNPIAHAIHLQVVSRKIYEEVKYNSSLICLSEVSDSQLMWAHYGAGHNGIVFGYAFDDSAFREGRSLNPVRVRYESERPTVSQLDLVRFGSRSPAVDRSNVSDKVFEAMWLTKSKDWAYEKEWRVISSNRSGYIYVKSLRPVEVIIGTGVDKETRTKIEDAVSGRLTVKYATLNADLFSIDLVERRP